MDGLTHTKQLLNLLCIVYVNVTLLMLLSLSGSLIMKIMNASRVNLQSHMGINSISVSVFHCPTSNGVARPLKR